MRRAPFSCLFSAGAALYLLAAGAGGAPKQPVYVGVRACGTCHSGPGMGHQYSRWLHTKHSRAYATLALPEALRIAAISGVREPPQEAPACLGCHATGFNAEPWEKDETFRLQDGIQCETCHGPGSEYAFEDVMRDRAKAMEAGLRMPDKKYCMTCHIEKGSHVAVLQSPQLDVEKAWKQISHPSPPNPRSGSIPKPASGDASSGSRPKYAGAHACGQCHSKPQYGRQFSVWRMSAHSRAWAVLALPAAAPIAVAAGVQGDPQVAPQCLRCHSTGQGVGSGGFLESFELDEGVGCEVCHGPGSEYMPEAIMRDARASKSAGLREVTCETCLGCHQSAHGKPFDYVTALKSIAHPTRTPSVAASPRYKNPLRLAFRPGSTRELWVTCEASDSVIVVDPLKREKIAEISVGGHPTGIAFTPDGTRAFVSNRHDDTVSVIEAATRQVSTTLPVGDEPHGLLTDLPGKHLYVLNTSSDDIHIYDVATLQRLKGLAASRRPWSLALSPDGSRILVTNSLARIPPLRSPMVSEVTVIETGRGTVEDRWVVPDSNLMLGVAWHPSGEFALATLNRTKSLVPMTRLMQGWTITNGIAVLWRDGQVDEVLLDEPGLSFADVTDVAFTRDGRYALATSASTDRVAVLDVAKLTALLRRATPHERKHVIPNHMGKSAEFLLRHIATPDSPRGIAMAPDGTTAFVANTLDDSLTVIDLASWRAVARIDLDGPGEITQLRYGERLFHSANVAFRRQMSCSSCHPDGHVDGITYDIESDGIGVSPVDNRTLRGILDTAPFKWEGTNPSLARQCGARLAAFFTRSRPFNPEELAAVDLFVTTIPRAPNRHRPLGASLTPAQRRGKLLFERARTTDGRLIPPDNRCVTCHNPPYYTDRTRRDVGTRLPSDRTGLFDVPHLTNIYDSAPYLHNGMAATLEEIWTVYNPNDRHGVTNDMTKDQLNDLIEYLKTL